jgi:hypothetical protein
VLLQISASSSSRYLNTPHRVCYYKGKGQGRGVDHSDPLRESHVAVQHGGYLLGGGVAPGPAAPRVQHQAGQARGVVRDVAQLPGHYVYYHLHNDIRCRRVTS